MPGQLQHFCTGYKTVRLSHFFLLRNVECMNCFRLHRLTYATVDMSTASCTNH